MYKLHSYRMYEVDPFARVVENTLSSKRRGVEYHIINK